VLVVPTREPDGPEEVEPLRLPGDNAVETEVGVRLEDSGRERFDE
jgi:hypothetical protein